MPQVIVGGHGDIEHRLAISITHGFEFRGTEFNSEYLYVELLFLYNGIA